MEAYSATGFKWAVNNKNKHKKKINSLKLFNRGKVRSSDPIKMGTNQLPKSSISIGITIKNTIIKACAVTTTLYSWVFPSRNKFPGFASSKRITK